MPARSGEFIPKPEEKSTLDRSKVLWTPINRLIIPLSSIKPMVTQYRIDLLFFELTVSTLMQFCNNKKCAQIDLQLI